MSSKKEYRAEFDRIYKETSRHIYRQAVSGARTLHDAEDIFQETYVELLKELGKGREINSPMAYISSILRRRLSEHYERLGKNASLINYISVEDMVIEPIDDLDIEESAVNESLFEEVAAKLRTKDDATRQIFYMYYSLGMSLPEISESMKISVSNVKNKLYRTLSELRKLYKGGEQQ